MLGILAGAVAAVPVFYLTFLHAGPENLISEQYPMPSATVWRAVAEILTSGLSNLSVSARWAALVGALLGIALEAAKKVTNGRFWLSGVGIGLAFVIPFSTCLAMFIGAALFWIVERIYTARKDSWAYRVIVENQEPICAGIIAGGALMGITVMIIETFAL